MSWEHRYTYSRPTEQQLFVTREPVDATCPKCGGTDVARYPIANHLGPRIATKCQACLTSLAIDRPTAADNWPPFRSVTYDWEASLGERASRELLLGEGRSST
jgi:hypothetical protein